MECLNVTALVANVGNIVEKAVRASVEKANIKAQASIKETTINANKEKCVAGLAAAGVAIVTEIIASTILKAMEVKK